MNSPRFYDSCLEIEDANSTTKIGYDELTGMTQDGECGLLWRGEDYVIRVMRGEFTLGSYEDFTAFINGKITENAEKKD